MRFRENYSVYSEEDLHFLIPECLTGLSSQWSFAIVRGWLVGCLGLTAL